MANPQLAHDGGLRRVLYENGVQLGAVDIDATTQLIQQTLENPDQLSLENLQQYAPQLQQLALQLGGAQFNLTTLVMRAREQYALMSGEQTTARHTFLGHRAQVATLMEVAGEVQRRTDERGQDFAAAWASAQQAVAASSTAQDEKEVAKRVCAALEKSGWGDAERFALEQALQSDPARWQSVRESLAAAEAMEEWIKKEGSLVQRPHRAEVHLRALMGKSPGQALAWIREGVVEDSVAATFNLHSRGLIGHCLGQTAAEAGKKIGKDYAGDIRNFEVKLVPTARERRALLSYKEKHDTIVRTYSPYTLSYFSTLRKLRDGTMRRWEDVKVAANDSYDDVVGEMQGVASALPMWELERPLTLPEEIDGEVAQYALVHAVGIVVMANESPALCRLHLMTEALERDVVMDRFRYHRALAHGATKYPHCDDRGLRVGQSLGTIAMSVHDGAPRNVGRTRG